MTVRLQLDLIDLIAELTQPHEHREHYTAKVGHTSFGLDHVTKVPPLLHQLRFASPSGKGEELGGGGYESRPAASVESLDALTYIDLKAARWIRDLGEDDDLDTIGCVRRLNGLAAAADRCSRRAAVRDKNDHRRIVCCTWHAIEHDVRLWWAQARVATGWDSAAWRPDNTCPMCAERGTLRVKLVEQVGFCVDCRETWDSSNIGLLAEHIREESAGVRVAPVALVCWCSWPRPAADAWPALCPVCASPWCHRAGWAVAIEGPGETPDNPFQSEAS